MEAAFRNHITNSIVISDIAKKLYIDVKFKQLSEEYIIKYLNLITLSAILTRRLIKYQTLSNSILFKIMETDLAKKRVNKTSFLNLIIHNQIVEQHFIDKFSEFISKEKLIITQQLSPVYIRRIISLENVRNILINQSLNDTLIEENLEIIDMELVSGYQPISEEFIYKYKNSLNLQLLGCTRMYSTGFILKNLNKHCAKCLIKNDSNYLSIENIVKYQNLDDDSLIYIFSILEKHIMIKNTNLTTQDAKINEKILLLVESISWRQTINSEIIKKFINIWKFNNSAREELFIYQDLSEDVILLFAKMYLISDSGWRYISRNQKISSSIFKQYNCQLFKCDNSKKSLKDYNNAKLLCLKKRKLEDGIISKIHSYM